MKKLEEKLGLIELTPLENVYENPSAENLKEVIKKEQTYDLLKFVCGKDGLALQYASRKLITSELCEISVSQNGLALKYVPDEIIKEENIEWYINLCKTAACSDGLALRYIPEKIMNKDIIEAALFIGKYPLDNVNRLTNYPIAYVPKSFLTKELLQKVVERVPRCIKDVPKQRVTKKMTVTAVEGDGLSLEYVPQRFINRDIIEVAILKNELSIQYVPAEYITQKMCEDCVRKNPAVLGYLPEEYVTKQMCVYAIDSRRFSVFPLSDRIKMEKFGRTDLDFVVFMDIPEKLRNDIDLLDAIIQIYKYGSLPLLRWNQRIQERINEGFGGLLRDKRNCEVTPLHEKTVSYLLTKYIDPEEEQQKKNNIDLTISKNSIVNSEKLKLPSKNDIPLTYSIMPRAKNELLTYDFSEYDKETFKIHYISDIHIEHQIMGVLKKVQEKTKDVQEESISDYIRKKISKMVSDVYDRNDMLLIGGDVADSIEISQFFYNELRKQWRGGPIISILGNHELWDSSGFPKQSVEKIVEKYKGVIQKDSEADFLADSILLENEVFIRFKDRFTRTISAKDILSATKKDLTEFFAKCTLIILGGIGYSGLNPVFNQRAGLYRKTINSLEEDKRRSESFKKLYDKVLKCAKNRRVIVLTHTPVYDWTQDKPNPNWIYVNGHTHKNSICISEDGTTVLSDNQIGYKPIRWNLHSFTIDAQWFDPFENYKDGIYEITSDEYREFNKGRGILCKGCSYAGKLYMLKRDSMYMFLLESSRSLCLMVGGQRRKLFNRNVDYYYDNLKSYSEKINKIIQPYKNVMTKLSEEIKKIGGSGTIHGCIVDISFFSHIYVNPFDGKITPYWATDIMSRKPYENVKILLEKSEPYLLKKYKIEAKRNTIPLISKGDINEGTDVEISTIPEWVFGTEIYQPSRIMKAIQYVWEQNVIRIWNDDVLNEDKQKSDKSLLLGKND